MKRFFCLLPFLAVGLASCQGQNPFISQSPEASSIEPSTASSAALPSSEEPASIASSVLPSEISSSEAPISSLSSSEMPSVTSEPTLPSEEPAISSESLEPEASSEPPAEHSYDPHELYGGYYASLDTWENGEDLKEQLYSIIHGGTYQPIEYAGSYTNWASNQEADEYLYDHEFVDPVYSNSLISKDGTNTYWQREHAFCASLMTGTTTGEAVKTLGRATDFHNLFASTTNGNTSRGNKNYGVADKNSAGYTNRLTNNGEDGYAYDTTVFEPGNHDKGRLSRAIFYMATMYCKDEVDNDMKALTIVEEDVQYSAGKCQYAIGHLSDLLSWSEYAVDLAEYRHNESVYSFVPATHSDPAHNVAQGNRNPYVDFPGLVDCVFGSKKDQPGSLSDYISSYETLNIDGEGVSHYAIETAKRQYNEGEEFHLSDINLLAVSHDLSETPTTDFTVEGATDGEEIPFPGNVTLTIKTPINEIKYDVLVETDPIESATWKHKVTAKSTGNDFYNHASEPGQIHTLDFDDVKWDVVYKSGSVQSNSAALGAKFGTATAPVQELTFETTNDFAYEGKTNITGIYLRGATAANCTYKVSISVGETKVGDYNLTYVDTKTTVTVGRMLSAPLTGKIKIAITGITNAVYVQYLAVHAE